MNKSNNTTTNLFSTKPKISLKEQSREYKRKWQRFTTEEQEKGFIFPFRVMTIEEGEMMVKDVGTKTQLVH